MIRGRVYLMIGFVGLGLLAACLPTEPKATEVVPQPEVTETGELRPPVTPVLTATRKAAATISPTASPNQVPPPTPTSTPSPWQKIAEWPISFSWFELSPDGKLLAASDPSTGILYIFDASNQKLLWQIEEQNYRMTGYVFDFTLDGTLLAGGGVEQDVYIWDMRTGEKVLTIEEPYDAVYSLSFSPDGKQLAVSAVEDSGSPYGVIVWETETGQIVNQFPSSDFGLYVIHAVFVPNHTNLLAIATSTLNSLEEMDGEDKLGGLYFWNVDTDELYEVSTGFISSNVATSPNGRFVTAYIDGELRVWDTQEEQIILATGMKEAYITMTDFGRIATLDRQGTLTVLNLQGQLISRLETGSWISDVAFTPDGNLLIGSYVGQEDQPIELWRLSN